MAPRCPARRGEDQPSTEQRYGRTDDQQFDIDLRDHPGDERGPCHPSHDARYAEKQDEGKDQLERAVLGQWSYPFRRREWAWRFIHRCSIAAWTMVQAYSTPTHKLRGGSSRFHDRFRGVGVRPIAIALVPLRQQRTFGVTYCTARGDTFEKSEPSPSAIVGCAKIASRNMVYGSRPTIAV
jgi:hypothetical protein